MSCPERVRRGVLAVGLCGVMAASGGCAAHRTAAASNAAVQPWWYQEDSSDSFTTVVPQGPLPQDKRVFLLLQELEAEGALGDISAQEELGGVLADASQAARAAAAMPLLRAGVYEGTPGLITLACELEGQVTNPELQHIRAMGEVELTCGLLHPTIPPSGTDACSAAQIELLGAWRALERGDEPVLRERMSRAFQWLSACDGVQPPVRNPTMDRPGSVGFLLDLLLQYLGAPAAAWMAGELFPPSPAGEYAAGYRQSLEALAGRPR